jgi:conjugative transfer region lipoprotein (TIGR03751 family)
MNQFTKLLITLCITLPLLMVVGACTSPRAKLNNQDGPTMLDIYRTHMDGLKDTDKATRMSLAESAERLGQPTFLHTSAREIDARFARLPNPDLVMYVTPHLTASRSPVPGYTTVFPMYETVEYALPGEVRITPAARALTTSAATQPAIRPTTLPVAVREGSRASDTRLSRNGASATSALASASNATGRSE